MRLSEAREALKEDFFDFVEIRRNPAMLTEYIVLLYGYDGKSFMLADESDSIASVRELEHLIVMLKEAGFRKARIYF